MTSRGRRGGRWLGMLQLLAAALHARALVFFVARVGQEDAFNPMFGIAQPGPGYRLLLAAAAILTVACFVLALASGLGFLGLRPWAWLVAVWYCATRIAVSAVEMFNLYFNILRPGLAELPDGAEFQPPLVYWVAPMLPFIVQLVYSGVLLSVLFLMRARLLHAERSMGRARNPESGRSPSS